MTLCAPTIYGKCMCVCVCVSWHNSSARSASCHVCICGYMNIIDVLISCCNASGIADSQATATATTTRTTTSSTTSKNAAKAYNKHEFCIKITHVSVYSW